MYCPLASVHCFQTLGQTCVVYRFPAVNRKALNHYYSTSSFQKLSPDLPLLCFCSLSPEYVDNLKDEGRVCGIIDRLLNYLENKGSTEEICRVYLRRIMHTYYKFDYKAHRRSLGLQGETKVRDTPKACYLNCTTGIWTKIQQVPDMIQSI